MFLVDGRRRRYRGPVNPSTPELPPASPVARGYLRAADADRDQVATVLSTAYAEGRLSREEHDERLHQVLAAKTFDDLIPITRDLVDVSPGPSVRDLTRPPAPASTVAVDDSNPQSQPDRIIAVFGGIRRSGQWRVRRQIKSLALFGGVDLDLRDAFFENPVVEIAGFWCFGGMQVKLPEGMEVRDQTAGVFGGTDIRDLGRPQPGAPTLVIKGLSLFGGVSVRGPGSAMQQDR